MRPVPEWRRVLRHAWSLRWMAATVAFGVVEAVINVVEPPSAPLLRFSVAILGSVAGVGGFVSRLMVQRHLTGTGDSQ